MDETLSLIVLADDPLARAGLAALLANLPGFTVATQAPGDQLGDAAAGVIDAAAALIVWDVGSGRDWAIDREPDESLAGGIPVLALVADEDAAVYARRSGCRGVLARDAGEERLIAAMPAVIAGLIVISPAFVGAWAREPDAGDAAAVELTPREVEVLSLLAEGLTNKAIARRLTISEHTVKFHVNAIMSKLDAQSRTDAVVRATRQGLIAL
jgi:DNA-binding NarL/FixJ family response regulator